MLKIPVFFLPLSVPLVKLLVTAICCVMQQKKRLLKFAEYLGHCSREATDYGKCVASNAERIRKDDCSAEFEKLVACFKKRRAFVLNQIKGTSIICGPMKVKRLKRAAHILTFYRYNFRFYPPFSVLLDGTFCQAALQYKINLREQMPKYLAQSVEMSVTKCVLNELEQLGKPLHGALVICQQFRVAFCPHKPMRTASKCIAHLARRSRDEGNPKYIVGTQDDELMGELRSFGGIPILSIRFNTILLEQPSEESKIIAENKPSEELERVKELKNEATVPREKRKRKAKGPNPLSCKRKQKKKDVDIRQRATKIEGKVPGAFGRMTNKGKRSEEEGHGKDGAAADRRRGKERKEMNAH